MLEKKNFEESFIQSLNKNFDRRAKLFQVQNYKQFTELDPLVFEINKCIILEFHRAAITLTNHFLERLLKISLIYNDTGIGAVEFDKWNEVFNEPTEKYNKQPLGKSIQLCREEGLINESEKSFLHDRIRDLMRNGFAHADFIKILSEVPDQNTFFHGTFSNPKELNPIQLNQKKIPILETVLMDKFSKANAENYFDYVFELSKKIENRLIEKKTVI